MLFKRLSLDHQICTKCDWQNSNRFQKSDRSPRTIKARRMLRTVLSLSIGVPYLRLQVAVL